MSGISCGELGRAGEACISVFGWWLNKYIYIYTYIYIYVYIMYLFYKFTSVGFQSYSHEFVVVVLGIHP